MDTSKLKKFAQFARRYLLEQVWAKMELVLAQDSAARREHPQAVEKLENGIRASSKEQIVERVAYIWFNRFCALRFMDVNRYTRVGVVSPSEGQSQPEILAEAKMGHIDESMVPERVREEVFALLAGKAPSNDPQGEAHRLLVVSACNFWNKAMPFLFQRINDYTELLMPDDLLSGNCILAYTREAMTPEVCEDVEVIGWLYQFYISEKKDEVFDGLKKNKKITPENIPAATQLFTPHWIVRYLVENSLGRLWLLNRPGSKLVEHMDYYIKPEQAETDFLRISKPEEIKICDPACGSGHMLTYAFDLLYSIYEEEGYEPAEIPEKILTHNLYGIEIDERAGELAAFALTMKARANQRRFFNKGVKPNICVLENVHFDEGELKSYMDFVGRDLFTAPLQTTLRQFEEADNFGSLIRPDVTDVDDMLNILESKNVSGHLFLSLTHQKVLQVLRQADYLSPKYHIVVANPPYMGGKGMNGRLSTWAKENYPASKSDFMTMFMERAIALCKRHGYWSMINLPSWMFLSSFERLRKTLINKQKIISLLHLGRGIFGSDFGSVAFVIQREMDPGAAGVYRRLFNKHVQVRSVDEIQALFLNSEHNKYVFRQSNFNKVPGTPLAYWLTESVIDAFEEVLSSNCPAQAKKGLTTGDNERFIRLWWEVSSERRDVSPKLDSPARYKPHVKGGERRKWYGNHFEVLSFDAESVAAMKRNKGFRHDGVAFFGKKGITWSDVTSGGVSVRLLPEGFTFNNASPAAFFSNHQLMWVGLSLMNSLLGQLFLNILNPTIHFNPGDFDNIPIKENISSAAVSEIAHHAVGIAQTDWNSYETSWDFTSLPLLNQDYRQPTLQATYQQLRAHWWEMTLEMQRLEKENNRIFIEAYGLQDELTPEVPLNEITLTCNPYYRYGNGKSEDELEALLLADTVRELVSYAVGCMFGRYALDKPVLILVNQGETIEDYYKKISNHEKHEPHEKEENEGFRDFRAFRGSCLFPADDDNVIPMLDGDWFTDDIAERFRKFLRVAFGEEHYEENLKFIEDAIGRDIRKYFLKDFYNDHIKRYKKRPIYWLFSSPKGSFNALIYMHRYRPDTVSVVLNDYLREFRTKLTSHKNHLEAVSISSSASQREKTKALKEIEKLSKMIKELEDYEHDVLYPLATEQVEIDLDDGVKVNYGKFGAALKKIAGLAAKEE